MKHFAKFQFLGRGIGAALAVILCICIAAGQNLVVSGSGSFSNTGTIKVKGNINTGAAAAAVTIGGTVELKGTTQDIGVSGKALAFNILKVLGTDTKTMTTNVSVADTLTINNGTGKYLAVADKVLTLSSASVLTSGSLDVSNSSGEVQYNQTSGNQTVLGLTYAGKLTLQNGSTKNLSTDASVAGAFTHTGGSLTVNHNLAISGASPLFATIADVAGNSALTLSGTSTKRIYRILGVSSGGTVSNSNTGLLTIDTLSGNSGSLNGGAGGVTFTVAATNSGKITGGAGTITFSSTLTTSADTVLAGTGGVVFTGIPTISSGAVVAGTGANLSFATDLVNNGTVALTGTGTASLSGNYSGTGSANFASGSTVTFNGAGQNIPATAYGNLTLGGTGTKTALGNITVSGTSTGLTLNNNLALSSYTLTMDQSGTAITGAYEITGLVRRNHTFTGGQAYAFHRANVTMSLASNGAADITLGMYPGTSPSTGIGVKYVQRKYTLSSPTNVATNNLTAQLYYTDTELQGSPNEAKLGLYKYSSGTWSKLSTNGGSYTRFVSTAADTIIFTGINDGLSGIAEIGIRTLDYITIANGGWNTVGTWGSSLADIPGPTDDAVIRHNVSSLQGASRTIAGLTIQGDATYNGQLTVDGDTLYATTIATTGTLNVSAGAALAVSSTLQNNIAAGGASTINVSGTANINGAVTNAGTFNANGASAVVNANAGFNNTGSLAVNNAGGQVAITGGDFNNTGSLTNAGTVTVQ